MADSEKVENVILGSGESGKYIAWELARQGRRTVVIERALIGGSCPNIACLPSKNVIHSAKVADLPSSGGVRQRTGPAGQTCRVRRRNAMVDDLIEIHRKRFAANGLEFPLGGPLGRPADIEVRLQRARGGSGRVASPRSRHAGDSP